MSDPPDRLRDALASRYAIQREVGSGGMATVYLATDVRHQRKVAVKVLRPELAATLGPTRFLREIEIAAQLQHPHILPLLDSGEADGFLYYVMPYIEGVSLRDRLTRQGELPVAEATRLLRDVADALSYAHGRGVVHRDIKPDNVMLSGRHALVMDFGVAKAVSEATGRQSLTTVGVALGTPAYMAPEQAAADPNVDHRADIYALGVMGYELLTGRPPFTGLTPQQVLAAHVTELPKPVTEHRASCPPALAETVMRCLAKRAADRWQSADEVVERLETLGTPSGGVTPTQTQPTQAVQLEDRWYGHPVRVTGLFLLTAIAVLGAVYFLTIQLGLPDWVPWGALALLGVGLPIMVVTGLVERRRVKARATGVYSASGETGVQRFITWEKARRGGYLAFALLALVTVGYTAMRLLGIGPVGTLVAAGRLNERDKVLISDFQNRSGDSTLGPSVTEAFRIDLAQSPVVGVFSPGEVGDALRRMKREPGSPLDAATAREVALREGARAFVVGEISPVGRGFVLSARLIAPADQAELVALRETADDDGSILAAIDRLSKRMRERIGESLRTIRANAPLEQVTTGSLEALRLYTEANHAANLGENDRAIDLLHQAIQQDSGFAMAWRKLAVALNNSFGSTTEAVNAATMAFEHRERLPEVERRQTVAWYYFTANVDLDKAVAAYRAVLEIAPDNLTALNNLSVVSQRLRRYDEAEQLATRAVTLGNLSMYYDNLINAQLSQGKTAEAQATIERYRKATPGTAPLMFSEAQLLQRTGDYDGAERRFREGMLAFRDLGIRAGIAFSLAAMNETRGRITQAERNYREFMTLSSERKLSGAYVAGAAALARMRLSLRGDREGALRTVEEALKEHPLATIAAADRPYADLAWFYAVAGQPARARALLAEYQAAVPEGIRRGDGQPHLAAGYTALAEGRAQEAAAEFNAWRSMSGCTNCGLFELGTALELANQRDSALAAYERAVTEPGSIDHMYQDYHSVARTYRRLGELYQDRGDPAKALQYYGKFVDLWRGADPELQPAVREVKERMAKLAGEGR